MKLRWKKNERVTGLAAVCAGPRGSYLWDGETKYATVSFNDGKWTGRRGWYWVCRNEARGEIINTCNEPLEFQADAKADAKQYVKNMLSTPSTNS